MKPKRFHTTNSLKATILHGFVRIGSNAGRGKAKGNNYGKNFPKRKYSLMPATNIPRAVWVLGLEKLLKRLSNCSVNRRCLGNLSDDIKE